MHIRPPYIGQSANHGRSRSVGEEEGNGGLSSTCRQFYSSPALPYSVLTAEKPFTRPSLANTRRPHPMPSPVMSSQKHPTKPYQSLCQKTKHTSYWLTFHKTKSSSRASPGILLGAQRLNADSKKRCWTIYWKRSRAMGWPKNARNRRGRSSTKF